MVVRVTSLLRGSTRHSGSTSLFRYYQVLKAIACSSSFLVQGFVTAPRQQESEC